MHSIEKAQATAVGLVTGLMAFATDGTLTSIVGKLALGALMALVSGGGYRLGSWAVGRAISRFTKSSEGTSIPPRRTE